LNRHLNLKTYFCDFDDSLKEKFKEREGEREGERERERN
jgi:hypothetical protein